MKNKYCGLDFGTSNSTLGVVQGNKSELVPLESGKLTLPSAIFFHFETDEIFYGREAITEYIDGEFGRLMRSLKSVLGTPLMNDSTQIKTNRFAFTDIISRFVAEIKIRGENALERTFDQVVIGRPVHFVDNDLNSDQEAQNTLEKAAKKAGFKNILFQYEPIAAALDYERQVSKEEIALIVDLGGGTSDFSVVRISPVRAKKSDRKEDILSNGGVHIGGTDFDKKLSLHSVMPHFGFKTPMRHRPEMEIPSMFHHDLATWHRIHSLYKKDSMISLRRLATDAKERHLVERLLKLVERRDCHRLAIKVEEAKIALTENEKTQMNLDFVEEDLCIFLGRNNLHEAICDDVKKITSEIKLTVGNAGLSLSNITKIFLTGGSTSVPLVRDSILAMFPDTDVVDGDKFGSVGLGLAVDAERKFA